MMNELICKKCNSSLARSIVKRNTYVQPLGYVRCDDCRSISKLMYPYGFDPSISFTVLLIVIELISFPVLESIGFKLSTNIGILSFILFIFWLLFYYKYYWLRLTKGIELREHNTIEYLSLKKAWLGTSITCFLIFIVIIITLAIYKPMNLSVPENQIKVFIAFMSVVVYSLLLAFIYKVSVNRKLKKFISKRKG